MSKLTSEQIAYKTAVLEDSATKAVYELQLGKDKAIRFILKNVRWANVKQARKALTFVCTSYKADDPDYDFS